MLFTDYVVTEIAPAAGVAPILAFANVRVGPFEIFDLLIVQREGGPVVYMPQGLRDDKERSCFVMCWDTELKRGIYTAVLAAWHDFTAHPSAIGGAV